MARFGHGKGKNQWAVLGVSTILMHGARFPPPAGPPAADPDLVHGVQHVADDLFHQLGPWTDTTRPLVIDPLLDGRTGQQNKASEKVQGQLARALAATIKNLKLVAFDGAGASQARWLITGTLTVLPEPNRFRLSVALSDRQTGIVVAQAVTPFRESGLDVSPTRFYGDSPSLVRDRSVDGYLRTAETPRGNPADPCTSSRSPRPGSSPTRSGPTTPNGGMTR